jgi:hypothetical protein
MIIPYILETSINDNEKIFYKHRDTITDNNSPHQLEFLFYIRFDYDDNNKIIKMSGADKPTKGATIPWVIL